MEMTGGEAVASALETARRPPRLRHRERPQPADLRRDRAARHHHADRGTARAGRRARRRRLRPRHRGARRRHRQHRAGHDQHHDGPVRGGLRLVAGAAHHRPDRERLPGQGQGVPARGRAPGAHAVLALPAGRDGAPHRGHRPRHHRRGRGHPHRPAAAGGGGDPDRPAVPPGRRGNTRPAQGHRLRPRRRRPGQGGRGAVGRDQAGAVGRRRCRRARAPRPRWSRWPSVSAPRSSPRSRAAGRSPRTTRSAWAR